MSAEAVMRSEKDRLRDTTGFEIVLLAFLIPAGAVHFDKPIAEIGVLGALLLTLFITGCSTR